MSNAKEEVTQGAQEKMDKDEKFARNEALKK